MTDRPHELRARAYLCKVIPGGPPHSFEERAQDFLKLAQQGTPTTRGYTLRTPADGGPPVRAYIEGGRTYLTPQHITAMAGRLENPAESYKSIAARLGVSPAVARQFAEAGFAHALNFVDTVTSAPDDDALPGDPRVVVVEEVDQHNEASLLADFERLTLAATCPDFDRIAGRLRRATIERGSIRSGTDAVRRSVLSGGARSSGGNGAMADTVTLAAVRRSLEPWERHLLDIFCEGGRTTGKAFRGALRDRGARTTADAEAMTRAWSERAAGLWRRVESVAGVVRQAERLAA
jgi:hypothetical protein